MIVLNKEKMKYSSVFLAVAISVAVVGPCSSAPAEAAEDTVLGVQDTSDRVSKATSDRIPKTAKWERVGTT